MMNVLSYVDGKNSIIQIAKLCHVSIIDVKKYLNSEYISSEVEIRIANFKPQRILITGEVRAPGVYKFPGYNNSGEFSAVENIKASHICDIAKRTNFSWSLATFCVVFISINPPVP